jgi:hypothetical protein
MKDKALFQRELEKYRKAWALPEYKQYSPGGEAAPKAIEFFHTRQKSLWDFGCGNGKALERFRKAGFVCKGIDFVRMDQDAIEGCLWDLDIQKLGKRDFGFCVDVMEHIPTEKVSAVLHNIWSMCRSKIWFGIALTHDRCGELVGETLHLTVQPVEWWREMLQANLPGYRIEIAGENSARVSFRCSN